MKIKFIKNGRQTDAVCDLGFKQETVHLLTADLFRKSINVNTYELRDLLKVSYLCATNNEFCKQFKDAVRDGLLQLHSTFSKKITTVKDHPLVSFDVVYSVKCNEVGIMCYINSEHMFTREYNMNVLSAWSCDNDDSIRNQAHTIIKNVFAQYNEFFKSRNNYYIVLMYELLIDKMQETLNELKDNYNNYLNHKNYNK